MVVKNNLTKKFNCDKSRVTIKVPNYMKTGMKFGEAKKMVKNRFTVFPSKDSSTVKVMRSQVNIPPIKIHSPMRMIKNNPTKVHFKRSKVEQGGARWSKVESENRVCKKRDLVNNYENIEMVNR